jgi:ABC-type nitrate/sulfonate/bicarbonate transport system substrate-binding protein
MAGQQPCRRRVEGSWLTRRWIARAVAGIVGVSLAVGCASPAGASAPLPAASAPSSSTPLSLTVGIPQVNAQFADAYWAEAEGIWKSLNLNVTISVTGATETTSLAAGRLVVGVFGTTAAFAPAAAGRSVGIVLCEDTGDSAAGVVVQSSNKAKTLLDMSGQSVGVVGSAGQGYGTASAFSSYIQQHGGKPLKIVVEASLGALVASLLSGQVQGAIQTSGFEAAIAAGKAREIVQPTDPKTEAIVGTKECSTAYWGTTAALSKNRTAVERFIAGMRVARQDLAKASNAQVAAVFAKLPDFAPSILSHAALVEDILEARPFFSADDGFISEATWNASLKSFATWGLSSSGLAIDLSSDNFSYPKIVDMSYWNGATALVKAASGRSTK